MGARLRAGGVPPGGGVVAATADGEGEAAGGTTATFTRIFFAGNCAMLTLPLGSTTQTMTFPLWSTPPMSVTVCPAGNCTAWPAASTVTVCESSYSGAAAMARYEWIERTAAQASVMAREMEGMRFIFISSGRLVCQGATGCLNGLTTSVVNLLRQAEKTMALEGSRAKAKRRNRYKYFRPCQPPASSKTTCNVLFAK